MHGQENIFTPATHLLVGAFKGTAAFWTTLDTHLLSADHYTYPLNVTVHGWV
jgi:hypothetical protein